MQMLQNSFLARDVALERLSELTKNFSGAEIEGLVKDAVAYALNRQVGPVCQPAVGVYAQAAVCLVKDPHCSLLFLILQVALLINLE